MNDADVPDITHVRALDSDPLRSLSFRASAGRGRAGRRIATTSPEQSWIRDWSSQPAPKKSGL
eukprot:548095-Alexandrium_andersonii.AAC.1